MAKENSDKKDILYMYAVWERGNPILVLTDPNNKLKNSRENMGALLDKISKDLSGKLVSGGIELIFRNPNSKFLNKSIVYLGLEEFYLPETIKTQGHNIKSRINKGFLAGDTALEQLKNYLREHFELKEEQYKLPAD